MSKLPTAEDLAYVTPRPGRGVTEFRAPNIQPDVYTGGVLRDIGAMMQKEAEEMSDLQAQDALNKLREQRTALTYDPEKGFMGVKGGAVIDRKVLEVFPQQFDKHIEDLAAGIGSAKAQAKFRAMAAHEKAAFSGDVARHSLREVDTYHTNVFNAQVQNAARTASTDLTKAEASLAEVSGAVDKELLRRGYGTETPENKVVRNAFRAESLDVVHTAVLNKMIADDQISEASTYMKLKGDSMSEKTRQHFAPMLKSLTDFDTARSLANEARQQVIAGKSPSEVNDWLSTKATNPRMLQEAQSMFDRATKQAREDAGDYLVRFENDPTRKTSIVLRAEINANPKLAADDKAYFLRYIDSRVQQKEDHARVMSEHAENRKYMLERRAEDEERRRLENDPQALMTYALLAERVAEGTMPEAAIVAYMPVIGKSNAMKLVAQNLVTDHKARQFTIQQDMVKEFMPQELLLPQNREKQNTFKALVSEALVEWKDSNRGQVPDLETQRSIVQSATKKYAQAGAIFGAKWTSETEAYNLKPMPPEFVAAAEKAAGRTLTRDQLLGAWALDKRSRR